MKGITQWLNDSTYIEPLSPGCKLCAKGAELVLLVTGLCPMHCFYCPLSMKKYGNDVIYADEWKLKNENDVDTILKEAQYINAKGAGITGGDPLLVWKRTKRYISTLKDNFGDKFNIHLYTSGMKGSEHIPDLCSVGLNEIRFHPTPLFWNNMNKAPIHDAIKTALDQDLDVAIEIPVIPDTETNMISLIKWAARQGIRWINLNELEFSESNCTALSQKGYQVKSDISAAVKGSKETAYNVINAVSNESFNIGVHYCSSSFKDGIQLKNRIKRRASNVARPYEIISDEGLLIKGVIFSENISSFTLEMLKKRFGIQDDLVAFNAKKNRIEIAGWILEEIADDLLKEGFECYLVEEYPTADRLEVERIPLPV